jgi:hypothetical protein
MKHGNTMWHQVWTRANSQLGLFYRARCSNQTTCVRCIICVHESGLVFIICRMKSTTGAAILCNLLLPGEIKSFGGDSQTPVQYAFARNVRSVTKNTTSQAINQLRRTALLTTAGCHGAGRSLDECGRWKFCETLGDVVCILGTPGKRFYLVR